VQSDEYDFVLAALPAPLVAGGVASFYSAIAPAVALGFGSLLAILPLVYALFVRPPSEKE
jgi:hypothetical protein